MLVIMNKQKKTISARLDKEVLDKLDLIQEKVVKVRFDVMGLNPNSVNKTTTIEWIIDYAFKKLEEDGDLWFENGEYR